MFKSSRLLLALAMSFPAASIPFGAVAQVSSTPPSTQPNHSVNDNGEGLNRNGPVARFEGCAYPENEDILAPWRQDRGFVKPSHQVGLLSNPYHQTGLAMNVYSGVPQNYSGHVPVYSEGNYWPYVGPQQLLPSQQITQFGSDRDLVQDAGLYFENGQVVSTQEPLFVKGVDWIRAVNHTDCSFLITAGSFPGTEQPGQVMSVLNPRGTTIVPLAPRGWWPDAVVPETYSSVAGLNPLHAPGWHHSSWSPAMYAGGEQARDFGTPGFAYNLDPNVDYTPGSITEGMLFANLRTAEGYDPLVSGDPGYGMAFYIDGELQAVIDMIKTNDYQAEATLVAQSRHNPTNFQQGPITVAGAIIGVQPNQSAEYHYLTHTEAQRLIAQHRGVGGWSVVTEFYQSNPQASLAPVTIDPVIGGTDGGSPPVNPPGDGGNNGGGNNGGGNNGGGNNGGGNDDGNPGSSEPLWLEAEQASLLGGVSVYNDSAASAQSAVGNTYGAGKGVEWTNLPAASEVTIQYASQFSGRLSYFVNGVDAGDVSFSSTGGWGGSYSQASVAVSIPQGGSFALKFQNGDTAMNIDAVEFTVVVNNDDGNDGSGGGAGGGGTVPPNPVPPVTPPPSDSSHAQYDPGPGRTTLLIGQNVYGEYESYVDATGIAPAGSSHYGSIYSGTVRGGMGSDTDSNAQNHLNSVNERFPESYSLIAVNLKDNVSEGGYSSLNAALRGIANGEMDDNIDRFAQTMLSQPDRKFLMRIGYEVNTSLFGNGSQFAEAFNHIARRLRETNGVSNVDFMYHPSYLPNDTRALYPGAEFVDFIGFSVFNSAVCMPLPNQQFCSPGDRINPALRESFEWSQNQEKPIAIAEAAPRPPAVNTEEGFKEYLDRLFAVVDQYDIRLLTYISTHWPQQGWPSADWGDSRLNRDTAVLSHWTSLVDAERYLQYSDVTEEPVAPLPEPPLPEPPQPQPPGQDDGDASDDDTTDGGDIQSATIRIEAESGSMLGVARSFSDNAASGTASVGYTYGGGNGVRFVSTPAANQLRVRYASAVSGGLSYFVNGVAQGKVAFNSTGSWAGQYSEVVLSADIEAGSTFELRFQSGDAAMNIDYVEFITQ
ncbi:glycosyl hydrolase [Marinibactrum halimedae]|uniref:CBM6 domain-containing protein n=1 Tax=Marinibactrum halimedae TaxID=1444977 RepID=A0AA37T3Z2_9GAMM|nr:glycosyl hydrolase [Marinibactrum halimedae]MCD9461140.1 hypothetical protein [Marinibactrum halimedae]GLS24632.1 hypothetical protein GCM10007877_03460 [Marinibactrum halimedae]